MIYIIFSVFLTVILPHVASLLCCTYGTSPDLAGRSCSDIVRLSPGCRNVSGMYWIEPNNSTNPVQVYCDMVSLGGGWERIIHYNTTMNSCPNGNMYSLLVRQENNTNKTHRLCTNNYNNVSNMTSTVSLYSVSSSYSEIMGLMTGYISGPGQGFHPDGRKNYIDLNTVYAEGISLVINDTNTGILKHVHTVTTGDLYNQDNTQSCFSYKQYSSLPPYIIGRDNTCTIATNIHYLNTSTNSLGQYTSHFGSADTGICDNFGFFCSSPTTYFRKLLPISLNSSTYPLLVRIMSRSNIIIGLDFIDIYVR